MVTEYEEKEVLHFNNNVQIHMNVRITKIESLTQIFSKNKEKLLDLSSSIALKADVLTIRTAGLPGLIFPSTSCPSHRTSFHEDPKAAFICFPKAWTS